MNARRIPLILLSGMGADERVFAPQAAAFENLIVPRWLEPVVGEPLSAFAKRMAEAIDPDAPCFLGGASFGGMVAMEMLPHLNVRAVFLIGSVRRPDELPLAVRMFRPLAFFVRWLPLELFQIGSRLVRTIFGRWMRPHVRILLHQLEQSEASFLRWAISAMLRWRHTDLNVGALPVFQIHGDQDRPIPIGNIQPTEVVQGGGHVISLTHAEQVNAFLRKHMNIADEYG